MGNKTSADTTLSYSTPNPKFVIRIATPQDAALIVEFMKKLGVYQKMADKIIATPDKIKQLLETKLGEAVFGIYDGETVGFGYFHQKSSAFTGRSGLYIDGFYVDDSMRGKGLGNIMMQFLSKHALSRSCEMLEWGCLDWNTSAIDFYQKQGSYCVDNMRIYRLAPEELAQNAKLFEHNYQR